MSTLWAALAGRVMVADGAIGVMLRASAASDFVGHDLADRAKLVRLIEASSCPRRCSCTPSSPTIAIVVHRPEAKRLSA